MVADGARKRLAQLALDQLVLFRIQVRQLKITCKTRKRRKGLLSLLGHFKFLQVLPTKHLRHREFQLCSEGSREGESLTYTT